MSYWGELMSIGGTCFHSRGMRERGRDGERGYNWPGDRVSTRAEALQVIAGDRVWPVTLCTQWIPTVARGMAANAREKFAALSLLCSVECRDSSF